MTIPNLMQKYTEQTTVKKFQKFYSTVSNAYSLAKKENGGIDEWGLTGRNSESTEKIYQILFKPYFKIAKDCGVDNTGNCISNKRYKQFKDTAYIYYYGTDDRFYKITLEDGATAWMFDAESTPDMVVVNYDVNGAKEPNQWGRDLFEIRIKKDIAYPAGSPKYEGQTAFKSNCNKNASGVYCSAWVIYKGNMDYLHCDDLDWNGKDKCK